MAEVPVFFVRIVIIGSLYWTQTAAQCFLKDFRFGVASSAYQIEGGWNASGKGENIWDHLTHKHAKRVMDRSNGDVSADSYHYWNKDVYLLHKLSVQFYRFSISWTRILPYGLSNKVNPDGVRYYHKLLDELASRKILPLVVMYHWDLPRSLQELGGWTNPILAQYFVDYARVLFENYGDKVKCWITFNEPGRFCREGYGGNDAPGKSGSGIQDYLCAHTVLKAHAMTYRMFDREYRTKNKGTVGINLGLAWKEPASKNPKDNSAAETARQFFFGWFAHPLVHGDYPVVMRQRINKLSRLQGYAESRLPYFTQKELKLIQGSYDFLGCIIHESDFVKDGKDKLNRQPSFYRDMGVIIFTRTKKYSLNTNSSSNKPPKDLLRSLIWVKESYNNPKIIVTEGGYSSFKGLIDAPRVDFLYHSLTNLHDVIHRHGCKVIGYTYYSLLDGFEWLRGYAVRYGLHEVNFASPERTRSPRLSARYYRQVCRTKCVPYIDNYKLIKGAFN